LERTVFNLPFHCRVAELKVRIGIEEHSLEVAKTLHFAPSVLVEWQRCRNELVKELAQVSAEPNYWLF
jgi:hypothetical protein